jgi:hypothetical protein
MGQNVSPGRFFPVDGEMIRIFPSGNASVREDALEKPTLEMIDGKRYLAFRVQEPSPLDNTQEIERLRLFPLDSFANEDVQKLQDFYKDFDFQEVISKGLGKGLEKITDEKIRLVFLSMLTLLNPRQVAILLYLYRKAHQDETGPTVNFLCNDLLDSLYSRSNEGTFPSNLRKLVNQDLWSLHHNMFEYVDPDKDPNSPMIAYVLKSLIRIEGYELDKRRFRLEKTEFDWNKSDTPKSNLPDALTVTLGLYRTIQQGRGYLNFPKSLSLKQPNNVQASRNYKMKLLTALLAYFTKDAAGIGSTYTYISLKDLFQHLGLTGKNTSRKKKIVWETSNELLQEKLVVDIKWYEASDKELGIQFQINPEELQWIVKESTGN